MLVCQSIHAGVQRLAGELGPSLPDAREERILARLYPSRIVSANYAGIAVLVQHEFHRLPRLQPERIADVGTVTWPLTVMLDS